METISLEEMRRAEERSEEMGVSRLLLMENAGRGVADFIRNRIGDLRGRRMLVVAGLGNNGGDGFVCARHLAGYGASVTVALLGEAAQIRTQEASHNWRILEKMPRTVKTLLVPSEASLPPFVAALQTAEVVIDAIFGTGIRGPLREPYSSAIRLLNSSSAYRVAVDVPSGVDPSSGEAHAVAVKAHATITFHKAKPGLLKAKDKVGELVIAPIGLPPEAEA